MDVIEDIRSILPDLKNQYMVKRIGIFGSYSRGEEVPDSDIDILVEFEDITFDNFMGLYLFLADRFDKKVDLVTVGGLNKRLKPVIMEEVIWCAA